MRYFSVLVLIATAFVLVGWSYATPGASQYNATPHRPPPPPKQVWVAADGYPKALPADPAAYPDAQVAEALVVARQEQFLQELDKLTVEPVAEITVVPHVHTASLAVEPTAAASVPSLAAVIDVEDPSTRITEHAVGGPLADWRAGYLASGANPDLLQIFVNGILRCESGFPDRDDWATVVSDTNDVGAAQINMAAHRSAIERIWPDMGAVASMQILRRNGHFAGVLALESGTGPWYRSEHCWG